MKATFVFADDWEGLYLDDKLVKENHSIDAFDILALWNQSQVLLKERECIRVEGDWLNCCGRFPKTLEEFKAINGTEYKD